MYMYVYVYILSHEVLDSLFCPFLNGGRSTFLLSSYTLFNLSYTAKKKGKNTTYISFESSKSILITLSSLFSSITEAYSRSVYIHVHTHA